MKRKLNITLLLCFVVLLVMTIYTLFISFQYQKSFSENRDARLKIIEMCKTNSEEISEEICNEALERGTDIITPDTISLFFYLLINTNLSYIQLLAPLLIIFLSSYECFREYSSGFYRNKLLRISYSKYLKKVFIKSLQCVWILPVWVLILFVISYFISGHFDYTTTIDYYGLAYIPIDLSYFKNIYLFGIVFIINIILNSIFYINLSYIPIKKNHNFIVCILSSYLLFIFWDIVSEILIGTLLFEKILNVEQASYLLNLFNYWVYDGISNFGLYTLINVFHLLISLVIVLIIYYKKENVVIASES